MKLLRNNAFFFQGKRYFLHKLKVKIIIYDIPYNKVIQR